MRKVIPGVLALLIAHGASQALAESTETAAQHFQAGLAYERLGRLQDAYTELQLASNLDAADAQIALALGVVALRLQRNEVAQRALEQSIVLDADSMASYYELALLYESQHNASRAADAWHRFLDLNVDLILRNQGGQHLQLLETSSAPVQGAEMKARLTIALGHAKVLIAGNQILERSNPILTSTEILLPAGPGQTLQRITAATKVSPTGK